MKLIAFDIETDGLLMAATQFHCGVAEDITTGERHEFTDVNEMYSYLLTADRIIAHNGRMFDVPVLERLADRSTWSDPLPPCLDTLLISRLLWPDKGNTPARGHSLEKWADFFKVKKLHTDIEDWSTYDPRMLERCHSDVDATVLLYRYVLPKLKGWGESVQLEHTVATIITKQIQNGFPIDMERVEALEHDLMYHRAGAMDELGSIPDWVEEKELKTPEYWIHPTSLYSNEFDELRYARKSDAPAKIRSSLCRGPNKIKRTSIPFNSASSHHKIRLFKEKYNWKPTKFNKKSGSPVMDAKVMKTLPYPEAKTFTRLSKIKTLLDYTASWQKYERDGRIHGDVITTGTGSSRMSHSKPNMNVPKVGKPWGKECRECFVASEGRVLVGSDASGLQERGLSHFMARWDGGAYARTMETGCEEDGTDSHSVWCKALGYPDPQAMVDFGGTTNKAREQAKTHKYATMFGGQTAMQAGILGISFNDMESKQSGMYKRLPGLEQVTKWIQREARTKGYVVGLDGRQIPLASEHSALAFLLQGFEAVVMKKALCFYYEEACKVFGEHGKDWGFVVNVHDEYEAECIPEIADGLGQIASRSITRSGEYFNLNVRLDAGYAIGETWADVH
tara:strand:+ start:206 stop:2068 length:1863 start_codon:yes stop_codon:yes gene_type:complete